MTSERQREANRANAKKSTGPKSSGGKHRASQNARLHGLRAQVSWNSERSASLERLTAEIVESSDRQISAARAREIAEAELDLRRVCSVESSLIADLLAIDKPRKKPKQARQSNRVSPAVGLALRQAIVMTEKIDSYRRRAAARRARAIRRAFDDEIE